MIVPTGIGFLTKTLDSLTGRNNHRHFPAPWAVEEHDACFIVRDADYQTLAYIFYEQVSERQSLKRAEAKLIADHIARLPELQETSEGKS
jgi:hypothetical protein